MRRQLSFAFTKLKLGDTVVLSAYGQNVAKSVKMVEILKLRLGLLHQETSFDSLKYTYPNDKQAKEGERKSY